MRTCGTMRHHDGLIILPLPRLSSAVAADLVACNKGGDPGRKGFFSEGNEVVIKIGACSGTITIEGMPRSTQRC